MYELRQHNDSWAKIKKDFICPWLVLEDHAGLGVHHDDRRQGGGGAYTQDDLSTVGDGVRGAVALRGGILYCYYWKKKGQALEGDSAGWIGAMDYKDTNIIGFSTHTY